MARRKITPEVEDEIVAGIAAGLTKTDAATAAGVHLATLLRHEARSATFASRLTRASKQRTRRWLSALWRNAEAGDTRAIAELLDRCDPDYRKTANVDVRHSGTVKHAHHDMSAFADDEIDALAAIAERHKIEVSA